MMQRKMWTHLLNAEDETEEAAEELRKMVHSLRKELTNLKTKYEYCEASKLAMVVEFSEQMNFMRSGVRVYNKMGV